MLNLQWLSRLSSRLRRGTHPVKRRSFDLESRNAPRLIELLEDRTLLAVTQLGATSSQYANSSTLASYTVDAGTDRLLVVALGDPNTHLNPTAVTYNGISMLQGNATSDGAFSNDAIWYLKLGTGSAITSNIVVSFVGTSSRYIGAAAFAGVDQTTPVDVNGPKISGSITGTNLGSSLNVSSEVGDMVFDLCDLYRGSAQSTATTGAGQTRINDNGGAITPSGGFGHYVNSIEAGASTTTMSWTSGPNGAEAILHLAMNINQSAVAAVPDVGVTKTDGTTTAVPGQTTTYTIVVSNNGTGPATGASFVDNFPASITNATWTSAAAGGATGNTASGSGNINQTLNLPVGSSVTYTVTATIAPGATGSLVNTATVSHASDVTPSNNSATDTDTLTPQTNVGVTKTDGTTTAVPGQATTYTIVVSNSGPSTATSTSFIDNFPSGINSATWTSVAAGGASGNTASSSGNIAQTLSLPPGSSVTYTVNAGISANATGSLVNTATVSQVNDTNGANNSATDTDTLTPQTDVSVTKTDGVTSVNAGTSTTYTIVVSNSGPSTATSTSFTDNFPAAITSATWTSVAAGGATGNTASSSGNIAQTLTLPPGSSVTYTVTANVSAGASGSLVNTATVSQANDTNAGNNSATDTDTINVVVVATDVSVTKTDGVTTAVAGGSTTYTITVSNSGPDTATSTSFVDNFPSAITSATWTSVAAGGATGNTASSSGNIAETLTLPAGASVTYTVTANLSPSATGTLVNTATVSQADDSNSGNNSATDTDTLISQTNVGVTKTDGVASAVPGTSTTYTIVVSNSGPSVATATSLTDNFPAGITSATWTSAAAGGATGNTASSSGNIAETLTLPVGATVTYTVTANISASATGNLVNTATVSQADDTNAGNNSATDTDTLTPQTDISVTKSDGVTTAVPGTSTTYTIVVSNSGPSVATSTSFTDNFPAGITSATWTSVAAGGATGNTASSSGNIAETLTLPVGATVTYTVTANISAGATGNLVNTATVSQANDTNAGNNSATDTDTLTPQTDVSVTKTDGVTSVNAGDSTTYTIVVSNSGPSTATSTSLIDNFAAAITSATWTSVAAGGAAGNTSSSSGNIAETLTLPAGSSVTYTVTANVSAGASGSLVNTATVSQASDTNSGNNSATDTDTIVAQSSDVSVTKTDGVNSVVAGGTTTYTIIVSNSGPNTATSTSFTDNFPAAITSASWTSVAAGGATGNTASGSGNIAESLTLPAGASVTYTVSANISGSATGTLVNTATVSNAIDTNPANDSATDTNSIITVSTETLFIIDNTASSGYSETGSWKNKSSSGTLGYLGNLRYANPNATVYGGIAYDNGVRIASPGDVEFATANVDTATFTFTGLQAGTYKVAVTYAQGANRATNASFTVSGTGVSDQVVAVNQKLVPSSFTAVSTPWQTLVPTFGSIPVGGTITVTLSSAGANGYVIADAVRIERVGVLEVAPGPAAHPVNQTLSNSDLQKAGAEAIARWQASGITADQLAMMKQVQLQVQDLPGAEVGTQSSNIVTIDKNAAGYGWFIDKSLSNNSEFKPTSSPTELKAQAGSAAFGKMDLLTVVMHELGHAIGLDHNADPTSLMSEEISVGIRRVLPAAKSAARVAVSTQSGVSVASTAAGNASKTSPSIGVVPASQAENIHAAPKLEQGSKNSAKSKRVTKRAKVDAASANPSSLDVVFASDMSGLFNAD